MRIANTIEVRQSNALNILTDIECNPGITNAEIAQKRGLSVPTISNIVNILKNNNVLIAAGTGESSGGRRPLQLSVNPGFNDYIGVSISKHIIYLVFIDFEGTIRDREEVYRNFEDTKAYWSGIRQLMETFEAKTGTSCRWGLALPGFVDHETNMVYDTNTLGVPEISLDKIYEILGTQVTIGDSCRLAGMAQIFGKDDYEDACFVLLSRRISGVVFRNSSIIKMRKSSMDIGTMILDPHCQTSTYGLAGSFLDLCSSSRIVDILKESTSKVRYEDFFNEIENGNQEYSELWDEYLKHLTMALHNIFAFFGIDIVLGGEMAKYIEPYSQKLDGYLREMIPGSGDDASLRFSTYGEYDEAFGAALEARSSHVKEVLPEILKNAAPSASGQSKNK